MLFNDKEFKARLKKIGNDPVKHAILYATVQAGYSKWVQEIMGRRGFAAPSEFGKAIRISKTVDKLLGDIPQMKQVGSAVEVTAPLFPAALADAFAELERLVLAPNKRSRCRFVVMSPRRHADIRKFGRGFVDILTMEEYLDAGIPCYIWGAFIVVRDIEDSKVIFFGSDNKSYVIRRITS